MLYFAFLDLSGAHEFFLPHTNVLHSKLYRINYFPFKGDNRVRCGVPIKEFSRTNFMLSN